MIGAADSATTGQRKVSSGEIYFRLATSKITKPLVARFA
jgi:hypothetical protein